MSVTVGGEVVIRPDRRLYRGRKRPRAEILGDCWDIPSVIVWRTHDVDVATALAGEAWRGEVGDGPLPAGVTMGWFKAIPWDPSGCYDRAVVEVQHDTRGATPGVMFG
jgi:hypothetical protein